MDCDPRLSDTILRYRLFLRGQVFGGTATGIDFPDDLAPLPVKIDLARATQ